MAAKQLRAHSFRHAPRTTMAARQPRAHTFSNHMGTNMAARQPQDHNFRHAPGNNIVGGTLGPTGPTMHLEPTWLAADPGPQLPPGPGNYHGRCSPGPTAPAMPW